MNLIFDMWRSFTNVEIVIFISVLIFVEWYVYYRAKRRFALYKNFLTLSPRKGFATVFVKINGIYKLRQKIGMQFVRVGIRIMKMNVKVEKGE